MKINFFKIKNFTCETQGAITIIFAFLLIPFVLAIGLVIESSRVAYINTKLAYACDAAAIAGARYDNASIQTNAQKFFYANFSQGYNSVNVTPIITTSPDNSVITVSANSNMPTLLGKLASILSMPVWGYSQVTRSVTTVEIALVLDNTGSMLESMGTVSKIQALQTAATNLVNAIFQNQATSTNALISIVPFVASVNIGTNNKSWLLDPATLLLFPPLTPWLGCVGTVDNYTTMDTDAPPSVTRLWPTYLAASTYKIFGPNVIGNNDWTTIAGKSQAYNTFAYRNTGPNLGCGLPILPLTNNQATLLSTIKAMTPIYAGGTMGNLGLVWGWNTISPRWKGLWGGTGPQPYTNTTNQKYIVMVTDGGSQWGSSTSWQPNTEPTAYGYSTPITGNNLSAGLLGTTNVNYATGLINQRVTSLCNSIKSSGIQIFTVLLSIPSDPIDQASQGIFQQCASTPQNSYTVATDSDLNNTFANIAGLIQAITIVK